MKDVSSKQQTKQKYRHNYQQTGLPPQSALPISGKTNKQRNISTNLTLYKAYHFVTTGPTLGWQKPKGRNNSTFKLGKGRPQTHTKYNAKAEKY